MKKVIFNWKMNMNFVKISEFTSSLNSPLTDRFVFLPSYFGVLNLLANAEGKIKVSNVGIQNFSPFPSGDFTGEVSYVEARELGIDYVLVNHYEVIRNHAFDKNHDNMNLKIKTLVRNEFKPIVCIGNEFKESVEDVEKVVANEIKRLFDKIHFYDTSEMVIVYMPYFYANNNITISNRSIELQMKIVKDVLVKRFGDFIANNKITLLYGGPVEKNFDSLPEVDGLFIEDWSDQDFVRKLINKFNLKNN